MPQVRKGAIVTKFLDGPAAGVTLALRRSPVFIRAVLNPDGKWDALDQVNDAPAADEKVVAYMLSDKPTMMHLCRSRAAGGSAWFAVADYVLVGTQPDEAILRSNGEWRIWTVMWMHLLPERVRADIKIESNKERR
jgi:hypothetical protein